MMRCALPPREPKPPAVEHRRLPKKKRAPKPRQTEADAEIDVQTPLSPTDGAPRPKAEPARRTEAAHLEVAMIEEYGLPRCPGCWQPEHLCVCYVAACPVCGDEGRLLGPLEDRKTEELCDACAGGVRFDRRRRPSASA
jgi:hypothetical protein